MIDQVLLIDDDEITLMICEMVIAREKFARQVIKLKNGKEGIDFFQHLSTEKLQNPELKVPELILLDINMPVMNGWEFLDEFAANYLERFPDVKVCILTSSVDPLDLVHSEIHPNVIGFINKPLTAERIQEIKENERIAPFFSNG